MLGLQRRGDAPALTQSRGTVAGVGSPVADARMPSHPKIPFLLDLLRLAMRKEATAVYVVPWMPPTLRVDEHSVPLSQVAFTPEQATQLVLDLLDDAQRAALDRSREIQFSFMLDGVGRFRVHAFRRHGQPAMAIRPFAVTLPTPRSLGLPTLACSAVMADRGLLVLASRSAGLRRDVAAALVEQRNHTGQGELALLEDASRFWHEGVRCAMRQGLAPGAIDELLHRRATRAGAASLPLAVAWGELRDGPQLERVVRVAERVLCLVTIDADGLLHALQRLVALCDDPPSPSLRQRLAIVVNAVFALRGVPAASGGHDLAALDALGTSPDLAANIAEGDLAALAAMVAQPPGRADEHLHQLVLQGLVTPADAQRHAVDRAAWDERIRRSAGRAPARTAPLAPVTVDTGFADLFNDDAHTSDAFAFADAPAAGTDTQFDGVGWTELDSGPRGAQVQPLPRPNAPLPPESAQFHAWAPAAVAPGQLVAIDLWVARIDQADEVAALARESTLPPAPGAAADAELPTVALQLRIDGLPGAAALQRLPWAGQPARVRFTVSVPPTARAGAHAARVRITVAGLPIGELGFVLQVQPTAPASAPLEDMQAARRMLHSAYATHAPVDREAVLACLAELHRVAPGLDVFVDAPQLRSGERWRERIEAELSRRERLFLFWSADAAESPWVDFEWRSTLRRRGLGAIEAVLLQPPRLAPLPAELAELAGAEVRLPSQPSPAA